MTEYFLNNDGSLYLAKEIFGKRYSLPLSAKEVEELRDVINGTKKPFLENAPFDSIRVGDRVRITETYENSTIISEITVGYVGSNYISSEDLMYETENSLAHSYTILERKSPSHYLGDIVKDKNKSFWIFDGNTWASFGASKRITTEELYTWLGPITLTSVYDA